MEIIEGRNLHYRELNQRVRGLLANGADRLVLRGVNGQRYIGAGLTDQACLEIEGTAGNNLGAMMNGPSVSVAGNAQDGVGNTMFSGKIAVWGRAGDIVGYGMRGGTILIRGDAGWRVGIHMKSSADRHPVIVIGGTAGGFLGEYMAGGTIVVLGMTGDGINPTDTVNPLVGNYVASGMHGGTIFVRGTAPQWQISNQVRVEFVKPAQCGELLLRIREFADEFGLDCSGLLQETFARITPLGVRPYAHLYDHSA